MPRILVNQGRHMSPRRRPRACPGHGKATALLEGAAFLSWPLEGAPGLQSASCSSGSESHGWLCPGPPLPSAYLVFSGSLMIVESHGTET